jgi:hypothetical protein
MTNYTYWVTITETRMKLVPVVVDVGERPDGFAPSDRQAAEIKALAEASAHPAKREPRVTASASFWQEGDKRTPHEIECSELAARHAAENEALEAEQS